jgi:hypothetical protein
VTPSGKEYSASAVQSMLTGEGSKKPGAQAHRCQGPPHPIGAIPAREVFGCVSSRPHALYEWLHFYLIVGSSIQPLKTPRCYPGATQAAPNA